jgi:hypothetical protein
MSDDPHGLGFVVIAAIIVAVVGCVIVVAAL